MVVVISGYFDPLHVGHLEYIKQAKEIANKHDGILIAIVNNDEQAKQKKGKSFMNQMERMKILKAIRDIDGVMLSIDEDRSVNNSLRYIATHDNIDAFVNGGDVTENCREEELCKTLGIEIIYGLGDKIQSSSNLTGTKTVDKTWGNEKWFVNNELYCGKLITNNGEWSSQGKFHYHKLKDETFFILEGKLVLELIMNGETFVKTLNKEDQYRITPGIRHRFKALTAECKFIEVSTHHKDEDSYYD